MNTRVLEQNTRLFFFGTLPLWVKGNQERGIPRDSGLTVMPRRGVGVFSYEKVFSTTDFT